MIPGAVEAQNRQGIDGTVDLGFNTNVLGTVNNLTLNSNGQVMIQGDFVNLQPGEAIMIGGSFTKVGGFSTNNFAVLNVDGTASGTFRPSPNAPVYAIATQTDGKVIRIPIPSLTEDRRKELSRHVHKQAEEGRNGVRQVRRDANDRLKKLLKEHKISEDDERKGLEQIQKLTDDQIRALVKYARTLK